MKRLNEEMTPELLAKKAEGEARIAKFNADIAALNQQIAKISQQRSDIETELAKITGQSATAEDPAAKNLQAQQAVAAAQAAVAGAQPTSESLLVRINESGDEAERIQLEIDQISDQMMLMEDPAEIEEMESYINSLVNQLKDLDMDQMEHEAEYDDEEDYWTDPAGGRHYDDEEDPAAMYEGYDDEEPRFTNQPYSRDKSNWYQKERDRIQRENAPKPKNERKPREKRMTKREYEKELKDIMSSLKNDMGDYDHSVIFDLAENQYYNEEIKDYIIRRWQKEQMDEFPWRDKEMIKFEEPEKFDIIEIITNDLEMSESHNPLSRKSFYDLSEAYVEMEGEEHDEDEFIDKDYVFYLKIKDKNNEFIGKIFKNRPDGDWYGVVKDGDDDSFNKISYEPDYDEIDIVEFLADTYEEIEIIDQHEFNSYIDDDELDTVTKEDDIDEDIIGGSGWPSNSVASR